MPLCRKTALVTRKNGDCGHVTEWETSTYGQAGTRTKLQSSGSCASKAFLSLSASLVFKVCKCDWKTMKYSQTRISPRRVYLILATLRPTQNSTGNQSLGPRKAQQTLRGSSRHGKIPFWKVSLCTTRVYVCVCMCTFM